MSTAPPPSADIEPGGREGESRGIGGTGSDGGTQLASRPILGRHRRSRSAGSREDGGDSPSLAQSVGEIAATLGALAEWTTLHHLLNEVLASAAPFEAGLAVARAQRGLEPEERAALLRNWRPCQIRIAALLDFCEGVEHIGPPYERDARAMRGPRFAVDVAAAQLSLEDGLQDLRVLKEHLVELIDELQAACHRHLSVADRETGKLVSRLAGLSPACGGDWA